MRNSLRQPAAHPRPTARQTRAPRALHGRIAQGGNNPVDWKERTPWQDNLGALFTNAGQSTTSYSASTVDATVSALASFPKIRVLRVQPR
jgi:hypothetical protein